jgi:hypothetical protein
MRFALKAVPVAALVAVAVPLSVSFADSPNKDSVKGEGVILSRANNHFSYAVQSGPSGEDVHGEAFVHDNTTKDGTPTKNVQYQGPVVCLRVTGNRATFIIDERHVRNRPDNREAAEVFVQDNGDPAGNASPDLNGIIEHVTMPAGCRNPLTVQPTTPIKGDITVTDSQP